MRHHVARDHDHIDLGVFGNGFLFELREHDSDGFEWQVTAFGAEGPSPALGFSGVLAQAKMAAAELPAVSLRTFRVSRVHVDVRKVQDLIRRHGFDVFAFYILLIVIICKGFAGRRTTPSIFTDPRDIVLERGSEGEDRANLHDWPAKEVLVEDAANDPSPYFKC